jgi:hypothetical protein
VDAHPSRSNGLPATVWTPMADLHPQLADIMLTILKGEGVAAYVSPAPASPGSFLQVRLPDQPTDRLFVDAAAVVRARQLLMDHLPGLRAALHEHPTSPSPGVPPTATPPARPASLHEGTPGRRDLSETGGPAGSGEPTAGHEPAEAEVDERAWAQIMAAWEAPAMDPVPRWPASEDVEQPTETGGNAGPDGDEFDMGTGAVPGREPRIRRPRLRGDRFGVAGAGELSGHEPDEHFQPPDPPPVPTASAVSRLAWAGVLGGPAFIVLAALAQLQLHGWWALMPLLAFVAGFVTLVVRMRDRPDEPDNPDDGAVV